MFRVNPEGEVKISPAGFGAQSFKSAEALKEVKTMICVFIRVCPVASDHTCPDHMASCFCHPFPLFSLSYEDTLSVFLSCQANPELDPVVGRGPELFPNRMLYSQTQDLFPKAQCCSFPRPLSPSPASRPHVLALCLSLPPSDCLSAEETFHLHLKFWQ